MWGEIDGIALCACVSLMSSRAFFGPTPTTPVVSVEPHARGLVVLVVGDGNVVRSGLEDVVVVDTRRRRRRFFTPAGGGGRRKRRPVASSSSSASAPRSTKSSMWGYPVVVVVIVFVRRCRRRCIFVLTLSPPMSGMSSMSAKAAVHRFSRRSPLPPEPSEPPPPFPPVRPNLEASPSSIFSPPAYSSIAAARFMQGIASHEKLLLRGEIDVGVTACQDHAGHWATRKSPARRTPGVTTPFSTNARWWPRLYEGLATPRVSGNQGTRRQATRGVLRGRGGLAVPFFCLFLKEH